jgi:hypothetical protein
MNLGVLLDVTAIIIKFMCEYDINSFLSINKAFLKLKNFIIWETNVEMSKVIMLDYSNRFKNITFSIWDKTIYENSLKRFPQITFNEMISLCFESSQTINIKRCVGIRVVKCNWQSLNLDRKTNFMLQLIPKSITHYNFDFYYGPGKQIFDCTKYIPSFVTHLTFNNKFISFVINFPSNLKYLKICNMDIFEVRILNIFPKIGKIPNLEYLSVKRAFSTNEIYPFVKKLKTNFELSNIDIKKSFPNITHLTIHNYLFFNLNSIPQSVTHLSFKECFHKYINFVPHHITHLKVDHFFDGKININPECTSIFFGKKFNQSIKQESLEHLSYLKLSSEYEFMDDIRQFFKGTLDIY